MIVEELFEKPLVRDINGVVKAEQLDQSVIYTELDEYVVTKELDKHLRNFLETYVAAINNPKDPSIAGKVGVWVSGFFGSGKSHFIKILSYLLENLEVSVDGVSKKAYNFFEEKVTDKLLLSDIHVASNQSADVMLFNIDSRANTDDKEDAILKVFIKVFNERLGYCADHAHIAHMERTLDEKGHYERFKEVFLKEYGSNWEQERDAWEFCQDEIVKAFSTATGQSEESSRQTVENLESNFQLNIKNFSSWVNEYIQQKGSHNVIFLVDEVGQFIGKNTQMMLKLQTITEELGTACSGRAWVVVTSQADIDAVLGGMKSAGDSNDFSKIQGRFYTRISLSSSNTSEVIQKRLLDKTEPARERLNTFYADKGDILRNQLSFDKTTTAELENYEDSISFVDNYPFVPYHYPLLQKVFESIRTKGATGKHLAMGERSLLDAFQSAAKQIKAQQVGVLVPMHCFYQPIEGFLEPAVKRTIDNACDLKKLTEFDTNILKTLFLIRYVDVLKSTIDNLVTLAVDQIDSDKIALKKEIDQSLIKLEQEMLIARNGDEYIFLTNEEKEIENEIRNIEIEGSEQTKELSNIIFDDILVRNNKYRYPENQQDFKVSRFCNGHPRDGSVLEDLVVKVISPIDINYAEYSDTKCKEMSREGDGAVVIKLADEPKLWDELATYVKTARFLNLNSGQRPEQESLLREKANENAERKKRLRHGFDELFQEANFSVIGDVHTPKSG
ncbi:MAG TPA: BREX system P-loop protein BrxC, partial [Gammaproteobacteria bacterium]|nr:BREX system P-loop protein BrxC [Gammaproteobacteria bacterium]